MKFLGKRSHFFRESLLDKGMHVFSPALFDSARVFFMILQNRPEQEVRVTRI